MNKLYSLSDDRSLYALCPFENVYEEYAYAFADRDERFLCYWRPGEGGLKQEGFTRGEFWALAESAAALLKEMGLGRGDRVIQGFTENSPYDLVFRLGALFEGVVPVTVNWQADDLEKITGKIRLTLAKAILYDRGFEKHLARLKEEFPGIILFKAEEVGESPPATGRVICPPSLEEEKMIIFTSGTTGFPKGAILTHRSYLANRLTFDGYFHLKEGDPLALLLVNPLHHANSSALSDWGMRRRGAVIHLVARYTTLYWKILSLVAEVSRGPVVTALVASHIDFLDNLLAAGTLPVEIERLKEALGRTEIMLGSAPVGPTTIRSLLKYGKRLPLVRFGSTETCLQVLAVPAGMKDEEKLRAFEAGWGHEYRGEKVTGYYIGREHYPITRLAVVKAIDPGEEGYMAPCAEGEPGYLVTQGANIMKGYLGPRENTEAVFREEWYTGLRDIVFTRRGTDGGLDYYWMSRDSAMLIKGGANYSYDQVAAELSRALAEEFGLTQDQFGLAVVGLRIKSEHDDSCLVTVELKTETGHLKEAIEEFLLGKVADRVGKASRPDYVRFAPIPRSFKGEILYSRLIDEFKDERLNTP